jgi:hypothetical protein
MKFKKIEFSRQGNFIFALLLIHFIFFGFLSNVFTNKNGVIKDGIIYLYKVMLNPLGFWSILILFLIVFIMVFREQFFEYGIRNSFWLIPFIMIESWMWYWLINESFDLSLFIRYFGSIETYLSLLLIFGIIMVSAILGAAAKEKYKRYKQKMLSQIKV